MKAQGATVFIFGAGASYGARKPHPPLGKDLHRYVREYLCTAWEELGDLEDGDGTVTEKVRKELRELLDRASSFESLVDSLRKKRKRALLERLNQLMAYALTPPINDDPKVDDSFVEKPDLYDRSLTLNFPNPEELQRSSLITLNYDCLLERAICRYITHQSLPGEGQCLCKHVNYRLGDGDSGIEVLKPHGSINWVPDVLLGDGRIPANGPIPSVGSLDAGGIMNWNKIDAVDSPIGQGHGERIIAYYAPDKVAQANPGTLLKVRQLARDRIIEADHVTIIGVHLPRQASEDPFLSEILDDMQRSAKEGRSKVDYLNPDTRENEEAKSRFGFHAMPITFCEYVALLEKR